jgi:hypothetical protein
MKPGTLRPTDGSQVVFDQSTTVGEVEPVVQQKTRVDVDQLPDGGRSQLPTVPASRTDTSGESPMVRGRVEHDDETPKPKGKRQKFLKVPDAKNLQKQAKLLFRGLGQVLDTGVQKLRERRDVGRDFGTEES